jgi:hypothetical protein
MDDAIFFCETISDYQKGYLIGVKDGYKRGNEKGYEDGNDNGYSDGFDDGRVCFHDFKYALSDKLQEIVNHSNSYEKLSNNITLLSKNIKKNKGIFKIKKYWLNLGEDTLDINDMVSYKNDYSNESDCDTISTHSSETNKSEINELEINESEINESEINESEINESEINESETNESVKLENSLWKNVNNFSDVCYLGSLICQNVLKTQPQCVTGLVEYRSKPILYELTDPKHNTIKNSIIKYNILGFFTTCSQPGSIDNYKKCDGVTFLQRSFVNGYTRKSTVLKLMDEFIEDEHILIDVNYSVDFTKGEKLIKTFTEKKNKDFKASSLENSLVTATFINNEFPTEDYLRKIKNRTLHQITNEDNGIPFFWTHCSCNNMLINEYLDDVNAKIFDCDDVMSICIMNTCWGDNSMWSKILKVLEAN